MNGASPPPTSNIRRAKPFSGRRMETLPERSRSRRVEIRTRSLNVSQVETPVQREKNTIGEGMASAFRAAR